MGHVGITLGAGLIARTAATGAALDSHICLSGDIASRSRWRASLGGFFRDMDLRWLVLGALLPDVIDKPLGHLLFAETFSNGRIVGHTLLFLAALTLAGLLVCRRKCQMALLVMAAGVLAHIVEDQMWLMPQTFLWPAFGWAFEKLDITDWAWNILYALFHEPSVYVPELIGLAVIVGFSIVLCLRRQVMTFIKTGRMPA